MLISIIIPTYNCSALLKKTLHSVIAQKLQKSDFEVIVADDGSSDDTQSVALNFADQLDLKYCYQEDKGFRAAQVRNLGLAQAKGEYILFLDSGVVLHDSALQIHLNQIEHQPNHIQIGFCHGFEEHFVANNDFQSFIDNNAFSELFHALKKHDTNQDCRQKLLNEIGHTRGFNAHPWLFCWGGHLFGKAIAFRDVSGFDENFTHWGGEDVELGLRLYQAGHQFRLVLDALAYHIPHTKADTSGAEATHSNCHYIHNKHQSSLTERMISEDWESIVRSVA